MSLGKQNVSAPPDRIFIELPGARQETRTLKSGATIYLPATLSIEDAASSIGIVHSVGDRIKLDLQPGDRVAVSYMLAADYEWSKNEQDVEDEDSYPIFHRAHRFGSDILWSADYDMIQAVNRDGKWTGIGKWILLEEMAGEVEYFTYSDELGNKVKSSLIVPESQRKPLTMGRGRYVGGTLYDKDHFPIEVPAGATLFFKEQHRSIYDFEDGSRFIILPFKGIEACILP